MLGKDTAASFDEVLIDLYEERGYIFGIDINLHNGYRCYFCKTVEDGQEYVEYLDGDVYNAIDQYNSILMEACYGSTEE